MTTKVTKELKESIFQLFTEQFATGTETEFDFTNIPAGTKRISILFAGLQPTSSNDDIMVQIGDSGGFETSGYESAGGCSRNGVSGVASGSANNNGFELDGDGFGAASTFGIVGVMQLMCLDEAGTKWASFHSVGADVDKAGGGGGYKQLSGTLDRLRIRVDNGSVWGSGSVNILCEG